MTLPYIIKISLFSCFLLPLQSKIRQIAGRWAGDTYGDSLEHYGFFILNLKQMDDSITGTFIRELHTMDLDVDSGQVFGVIKRDSLLLRMPVHPYYYYNIHDKLHTLRHLPFDTIILEGKYFPPDTALAYSKPLDSLAIFPKIEGIIYNTDATGLFEYDIKVYLGKKEELWMRD